MQNMTHTTYLYLRSTNSERGGGASWRREGACTGGCRAYAGPPLHALGRHAKPATNQPSNRPHNRLTASYAVAIDRDITEKVEVALLAKAQVGGSI
jgi:hypothetical protein